MISARRVLAVDRTWRGIVFGRKVYTAILAWLLLSLSGMLLSVVPECHYVARLVVVYGMPAGFAVFLWLTASSYALTAVASIAKGEKGTAIWMTAWAVVLFVVGASGIHWIVARGATGE